jgi:two-component system cell cycle sensor histidine kinase/response regulator CckA
MRILVVEDESIVGRDIQSSLTRTGHEVPEVLCTGQAALEHARASRPDLVVMDVGLPGGMDGIEAGGAIHHTCQIPVIYLSEQCDPVTIARAREAGAYGYLLKPFNEGELQSTIEVAAARHASERTLETDGQRHLDTLNSMAEAVIATDLIGRITFINLVAEELTGWTKADALHLYVHEVFRISHPTGEAAEPLEDTSSDVAPRRPVMLTAKSGQLVAIEDHTTPIRDADGGLGGLVIIFRLRESDGSLQIDAGTIECEQATWAQLVGMARGIADPLVAVDPQWRISYANEEAAELFQIPRESLFGAEFWDQLPRSTRSRYYQTLQRALASKETISFDLHLEARALWLQLRGYPFAGGMLVLLTDITGKKTAEKQQSKLDKLESLGFLARGFAHDFNNLLTVLLGNLSLASMRVPDNAPYRTEIDSAKRATLQAQGLVQQLLVFAKGGAPIKKQVNIDAFVEQWFKGHPRKEGITYKLEIADGIGVTDIDPDQMRRVLANLAKNAEQAIVDGGSLSVDVRRIAEPSLNKENADREVPMVQICFADSGRGISAEDQRHVFEPYFTTRQHANATGIGLTVCESIAKAHGGSIALESKEGKGTTVKVRIPATPTTDAEMSGALSSKPTPEPDPPKSARILILEDEAPIRQLLQLSLQTGGYKVVSAKEGGEAVEMYRNAHGSAEPIDLFITDLTIPDGLGGAQAMEQILAIEPNAKGIVSSGYSDDTVMSRYMDYGFRAVLPKPYEPQQLLDLVKEILEE